MKVKILIMPLIIVIVVAISIWLVYPAYSNGSNGVRENYIQLKAEQAKLTELRNKSVNAKNLSTQMSTLSEKDILYTYIPVEIKEEEIINGLVNLSANSGLLLFDSKINQPTKEVVAENDLGVKMETNSSLGNTQSLMPKIKNLKTEIKLVGSYEKIRDFLNSLGKFSRSNDFENLEISRNASGSQGSDPNILLVSAAVDFNVLKKAKLDSASISNPVFSSPKLETKVIEDIKNQKNTSGFSLNVDQKGKNNIFQP